MVILHLYIYPKGLRWNYYRKKAKIKKQKKEPQNNQQVILSSKATLDHIWNVAASVSPLFILSKMIYSANSSNRILHLKLLGI